MSYSEDLYNADLWRKNNSYCSGSGKNSQFCLELGNKDIFGIRFKDIGNNLDFLESQEQIALDIFSKFEYEAALNRSYAEGFRIIRDNDFLLNRFANGHIKNYDDKGLQDKILLMTAYLTLNKSYFGSAIFQPRPNILIPQFWNANTLLDLAKENAPTLSVGERQFAPNVIRNGNYYCRNVTTYTPFTGPSTYCKPLSSYEQQERDKIIAERLKKAEKIIQDRKNREDPLDLNDPCGNIDLQNKKLSSLEESLIYNRKKIVSIPRGGGVSVNEFFQHKIEDAVGKINLDKYELDILKLPDGFDAKSLFEHIRKNFEDFATGDSDFFAGEVKFEAYSNADERRWNSNNPLGAAMDFNTLFDTATVITTEYNSEELFWTFTTVHSFEHKGHPVSGHRQFGLFKKPNGGYTFYLRGADRLTTRFDSLANKVFPSENDEFAFELAAKSWEALMRNVENFIRKKNGRTRAFDSEKEYGRRHNYIKDRCK